MSKKLWVTRDKDGEIDIWRCAKRPTMDDEGVYGRMPVLTGMHEQICESEAKSWLGFMPRKGSICQIEVRRL